MSSLTFTLTQPQLIDALQRYAAEHQWDPDTAIEQILAAYLLTAEATPLEYPTRDPRDFSRAIELRAEDQPNQEITLFNGVEDVSAFVRKLRQDIWQ